MTLGEFVEKNYTDYATTYYVVNEIGTDNTISFENQIPFSYISDNLDQKEVKSATLEEREQREEDYYGNTYCKYIKLWRVIL